MEILNNLLANQSLDPLFIVVFCMAFACLLLGFVIGRVVSMKSSKKAKIESFEKGKIEALESNSKEKAEISSELEKELLKIRESIIQSARAYESTVKVVQEKLLPPALTLDNYQDSQLSLDFKQKDEKKEEQVKVSKVAKKEIKPSVSDESKKNEKIAANS